MFVHFFYGAHPDDIVLATYPMVVNRIDAIGAHLGASF